jgi:hypothetical protein
VALFVTDFSLVLGSLTWAASLRVLCASNSTEEIKSRRMRWTGYVRMNRNAYTVLVAKPERDY